MNNAFYLPGFRSDEGDEYTKSLLYGPVLRYSHGMLFYFIFNSHQIELLLASEYQTEDYTS